MSARRVADRSCAPGRGRSPYGEVPPKLDPAVRATLRALFRRSLGSRGIGDGVLDRGASRRGSKPQVLPVRFGNLAGELLVGSQDRLKSIERVLQGFLAGAPWLMAPGTSSTRATIHPASSGLSNAIVTSGGGAYLFADADQSVENLCEFNVELI